MAIVSQSSREVSQFVKSLSTSFLTDVFMNSYEIVQSGFSFSFFLRSRAGTNQSGSSSL